MSLLLAFQNCGRTFQSISNQVTGKSSNTSNSQVAGFSVLASNNSGLAVATVTEECDSSKGWICMANPILPKDTTVGAWYGIYYYAPGTADDAGINRWSKQTRYRPKLGYYDSGEIIKAQEPYFKEAGINYLLLDHTNGYENDRGQILRNAKRVFDNLDHSIPIAIAGGFPLWNAEKNAQERDIGIKDEIQKIWNDFAQRPNYLKWFDNSTNTYKPLYVLYNDIQNDHPQDEIQRYWKDARFTVRYSAGYADSSNPLLQPYANLGGLWGWALHYPQLISSETIAVQPGHNTTHLENRTATPTYKNNGAEYMKQWLFAIKNRPKNIIIASWNDWAEETSIEPGLAANSTAEKLKDSYGEEVEDMLLQITAAYTNLRKGLMPNTFYKTEDNNDVYKVENGRLIKQSAMPRRKPVIVLPSGTLTPYINTQPPTPTPGPTPTPTPTPAPAPTPTPTTPVTAISEGLFLINNRDIYYSNGSAYCSFSSMTHFTQATGRSSISGIRNFSSIPSVMKNDGVCAGGGSSPAPTPTPTPTEQPREVAITEGLFVVGINIYYSNGSSYCYFPTMALYTARTGKTNIDGVRRYQSIPSVMRFDGNCQ